MERASHFEYRDEMTFFVIDVHLFYDEIAVVTDEISFCDNWFLSSIWAHFCHNLPSAKGQTPSATLAADVYYPRG